MGRLILKRRIGERILIGKNITVEVNDAWWEGGRACVDIAITAPPEVPVLREEVPDDGTRRDRYGNKYKTHDRINVPNEDS